MKTSFTNFVVKSSHDTQKCQPVVHDSKIFETYQQYFTPPADAGRHGVFKQFTMIDPSIRITIADSTNLV
ncbi:hypothetical protein SIID45300_02061 [Candidatus Magnetaquicoccaceae bacterium FCR-1]|uniref:Uncharacterized protein n=1 Tax=Candidatus Magnetaquiglobus chichijimensis TaxID=3141448 RepID=A0ABQ0CA20_9PROT